MMDRFREYRIVTFAGRRACQDMLRMISAASKRRKAGRESAENGARF
jgi:hypothetical protein